MLKELENKKSVISINYWAGPFTVNTGSDVAL